MEPKKDRPRKVRTSLPQLSLGRGDRIRIDSLAKKVTVRKFQQFGRLQEKPLNTDG